MIECQLDPGKDLKGMKLQDRNVILLRQVQCIADTPQSLGWIGHRQIAVGQQLIIKCRDFCVVQHFRVGQ